MNWIYKTREFEDITDFPIGCIGFVYKIRHEKSGKYYIGKKSLQSSVNKKLGKKELAEVALIGGRGRKPTKRLIIKESDWKNYFGSSKEFQKFISEQGKENFTKEILHFAFSKKMLSYYEVYEQFKNNVLQDSNSFNDNILGSFFRKDLL